jgi:hypothetical protein
MKENDMLKFKKPAIKVSAISLAVLSAFAFATETFYYPWYGTPYAYTNVRDCTWQYTGSYGGSWGSQFNYVKSGSCPWSTMQVNHQPNASQAQIVLN